MKVLIVTFFHVPWVSRDANGIQRRFSLFMKALGEIAREITLLHVVPESQIAAAGPIEALSRSQSEFWGVPLRIALAPRRSRPQTMWTHYGAGILAAGGQPGLFPYGGPATAGPVAAELDRRPDLVFAQGLPAMTTLLAAGRSLPPVALDMVDVEHRVLLRRSASRPLRPGRVAEALQAPALAAFERRAVAASALTFVCSERERRHLRLLGAGDRVRAVPNTVALPAEPPGVPSEPTLLLLGDMQYPPNRDAAERMARAIFPLVRRAAPGAVLRIGGLASRELPSAALGLPGVEHLGFVDDLDALYAATRVVVCPIATGGGTRLKLVEAAGYARPMVSTRIGAEGLDLADGAEALLRDDDRGFAEACVRLLGDDALCRSLGAAARRRMQTEYDPEVLRGRVAGMLRALVPTP